MTCGQMEQGLQNLRESSYRVFSQIQALQRLLECLSAPSGLYFVFFMLSSAAYGTMDGLGNWGRREVAQ